LMVRCKLLNMNDIIYPFSVPKREQARVTLNQTKEAVSMTQRRPFKIFHDGSHPEFFTRLCQQLGVSEGKVTWLSFSNEEIIPRLDEDVRDFDCVLFASKRLPGAIVYNHNMKNLLRLLSENSDGNVTLAYGYMHGIRSDKEDQPRIAVLAQYEAEEIARRGARRVILLDPHFPQIKGFFPKGIKVESMFAMPLFINYVSCKYNVADCVAVGADGGSGKSRSRVITEKLGLDEVGIEKKRDGNKEKAKPKRVLGDVTGKICLLGDDEVCSGSTIYEDAKFLLENGAVGIVAMVTHPILTKLETLIQMQALEGMLEMVMMDHIYVSPEKRAAMPKLTLLDGSKIWAEAIRCVHDRRSFRGSPDGLLARMYNPEEFPPIVVE